VVVVVWECVIGAQRGHEGKTDTKNGGAATATTSPSSSLACIPRHVHAHARPYQHLEARRNGRWSVLIEHRLLLQVLA